MERIGETFNYLTAISYVKRDRRKNIIYQFKCRCGNKVEKPRSKVFSGKVKSCGCLVSEMQLQKLERPLSKGERIGHFVVIKRLDNTVNDKRMYLVTNEKTGRTCRKTISSMRRLIEQPWRSSLSARIRNDFKSYLKGKTRTTHSVIGCSWNDLKSVLENQFSGDMSWKNYGVLWTIDHICPLAQAKTLDEVLALHHYSNLRPLDKTENIRKSDRFCPEAADMCQRLLNRHWIEKERKCQSSTQLS